MRRRQQRAWPFLVAEFLVVFISVSGAFYLDTVKEDRKLKENQIRYYETFLMNLEVGSAKIARLQTQIDTLIVQATTGEDFEIRVRRNLNFVNNQLIIRAGFEEQNFSVITPQYFRNLDEGSNLITRVQRRLNTLELRTQEYVFSNQISREAFKSWYINELQAISNLLKALDQAVNQGAIPATQNLLEELK